MHFFSATSFTVTATATTITRPHRRHTAINQSVNQLTERFAQPHHNAAARDYCTKKERKQKDS
jgi:hypothetical protein